MSFAILALIGVLALLGPALASIPRLRLPLVIGELGAGVLIGSSGLHLVSSANPTFSFLASIGFALVMFEAGSHVPVRQRALRAALWRGLARAGMVGLLAVLVGLVLSRLAGTGHAALYAVLMASSSAALVLPILDSQKLTADTATLPLLAQVAIADTVCIVALPLAIDPHHALRAALGGLALAAAAGVLFLIMRQLQRDGWRHRLQSFSKRRRFALELRVDLVVLFTLAALAVRTHVSVMLAGFSYGLVMAGVGEPRRLARQLFALTDGFLGPLFFVWLGASLNLSEVGHQPRYLLLGIALGAGAVLVHLVTSATGLSAGAALLSSAQLGVPVAAATLGTQLHLLHPAEAPALIVGAVVTIAATTLGASLTGAAHTDTDPAQSG